MLKDKRLIIFDLGGVVLDLHVEHTFGALMALGVDKAMLTENDCLMNDVMQRFDRGDITADDFFAYIEEHLPAGVRELPAGELRERVQDIWNMMLGGFPQAKLQRIRELRAAGYRVVMLSNTNEGHWSTIEKHFRYAAGEPLDNCFDALYLSYLMHRRKPEPEIFLDLLRDEGVEPADALFVDDSEENCAVARSLGIEAVHVERNAPWGESLMND